MSLSAVSLCLAFLVAGTDTPVQLSQDEIRRWKTIEPAIVYLLKDGQPVGSAALIDDRGYFLAHQDVASGAKFQGRLANGQMIELTFKAVDTPTHLVLLIAENWTDKSVKPVVVSATDEPKGKRLFALLPTGPIRAQFEVGDRVGMLSPSKRAMSLSEIRFEAPQQMVGGALVFTQDGHLMGALNATLQSVEKIPISNNQTAEALIKDFNKNQAAPGMAHRNQQMGPAQLTVAYTVGPNVLKRVVDGFRSPTHEVLHPVLGIMCVDAPGVEGALVDSVRTNSQAALAGIKKGDIIVEMDGKQVQNKVDYARSLVKQNVGDRITLKVRRGSLLMFIPLTVGK